MPLHPGQFSRAFGGRRRLNTRRYSRRFRPRTSYGRRPQARRSISAYQRATMPEIKQKTQVDPIVVLPMGLDAKIGTPVDAAFQHIYPDQWNIQQGVEQGKRVGSSYITKSLTWRLNFQRLADSDAADLALLPVTFRVIWLIDTMPNQGVVPNAQDVLTDVWGIHKRAQLTAGYKFENRSRFKILHDKRYRTGIPRTVQHTNVHAVPEPNPTIQRTIDCHGDAFYVVIHKRVALRVQMLGAGQTYAGVRKSAVIGYVLSDFNEAGVADTNHWFLQSSMVVQYTDA